MERNEREGGGDPRLPQGVAAQGAGQRSGDASVQEEVKLRTSIRAIQGFIEEANAQTQEFERLIAGLDRPDSGEIRIGSTSMSSSANGVSIPAEKRKIGFVFQSYALWPHMTVFEHVLYPLRGHNLSREQMVERVEATLSIVGLEDLKPRYPSELSGGQQRRVALAGVLAMQPEVLVLDEPGVGLDAEGRGEIYRCIQDLRQQGITVVLISHDMAEVMSLADQLFVLHLGRLVMQGTPREVFARPETLRDHGLAPPPLSSLLLLLRQRGLAIPAEVMTVDEAFSSIIGKQ